MYTDMLTRTHHPRRSDNSDDVLWFKGEKVDFDHNMLWCETDFWALKKGRKYR